MINFTIDLTSISEALAICGSLVVVARYLKKAVKDNLLTNSRLEKCLERIEANQTNIRTALEVHLGIKLNWLDTPTQ